MYGLVVGAARGSLEAVYIVGLVVVVDWTVVAAALCSSSSVASGSSSSSGVASGSRSSSGSHRRGSRVRRVKE